jgi:hypothetical protein
MQPCGPLHVAASAKTAVNVCALLYKTSHLPATACGLVHNGLRCALCSVQVPPALAVTNGRLVERASGAPAQLHGVNFFGWNTDTPNFDGLWAYNDEEVPGYDSVGDAGALQRLNISWWGKHRE